VINFFSNKELEMIEKITNFLLKLGYTKEDIAKNLHGDTFSYYKRIKSNALQYYQTDVCIKYIYIAEQHFEQALIENHTNIWNENKEPIFVVVSENESSVINAKVKPNLTNPLHKSIVIETFSYGVNSEGFASEELNKLKKTLGKEGIDSAYFFDFIVEKTKRQKTSEVDKDLLLNLIQLRNDLFEIHSAQETIHLLIFRCLFIKYLEDRGIYEKDYLLDILKTRSAQKLIDAFEQIKRINGDIFKYDEFVSSDIHREYLERLELFFSCFDYRTRQGTLFPYKFDKMPIQLISHVYEAFLSNARKGNKGIYYTPAFVVKFMLSHTVQRKLQEKKELSVFDPACGSGAFLVEAFKEIVKSNNAEYDYEKKVDILKKQIFGIDIDKQALQIATFSLYLALLEGEEPEAIQEKIRNAYPILPALINHTLIKANFLVDDIYPNVMFDCIVANPPWGSVPSDKNGDEEDKRERKAIGEKGKVGEIKKGEHLITFPEYKDVSDYQRSQAFLLRINKWCHKGTLCSLIVNNPIFLNKNAEDFRKELLAQYRITYFYELSHLNKILFKKKVIGKIKANGKDEDIEIGTSEPCAVIIFDKKDIHNNIVQYISPKLTKFSETFELIHYTQKDIKTVKQEDLQKEDYWLWRIFVNGSWDDYQLIKKTYIKNAEGLDIECSSGFQPKKSMMSLGEPLYQDLIELKLNPSKSDKLRIRGVRVNKEIIHKHNILCIKIKRNKRLIENYASYLALLNSSFLGYYIYHISSQWGKGKTFSTLSKFELNLATFQEELGAGS